MHISELIEDTKRYISSCQNKDYILSCQNKATKNYIPSGYKSIDRLTSGWRTSDLIIIAAQPYIGKTAFALTMARNMAVDNNIPVAIFSVDTSSRHLVRRMIKSETGLSVEKITGREELEKHEWEHLDIKLKQLSHAPIYIDDSITLSIDEFRSKAIRLVSKSGIKVIIIDYLQLMTGPPDLKGMSEQEYSSILKSLKEIAVVLNITIIVVSFLMRITEDEAQSNKKPDIKDLWNARVTVDNVDTLIFIHRPGIYQQERDLIQDANITIEQRDGSIYDVQMKFLTQFLKFEDIENDELRECTSKNT